MAARGRLARVGPAEAGPYVDPCIDYVPFPEPFIFCDRQPHMKCAASPGFARDLDVSAVCSNDLPHHGEPDAGTLDAPRVGIRQPIFTD